MERKMDRQSDKINLGVVLRLPRERLDDVLEEIAKIPDVFVVHRQASWLKLYVSEFQQISSHDSRESRDKSIKTR